jgi:hypothetical protein
LGATGAAAAVVRTAGTGSELAVFHTMQLFVLIVLCMSPFLWTKQTRKTPINDVAAARLQNGIGGKSPMLRLLE